MKKKTPSHPLFRLLEKLEDAGIYYTLRRSRCDAISVDATVVGQRVEIDVFADGHMELARFHGHEDIEGGAKEAYAWIANEKREEARLAKQNESGTK